MATDLDRLRAIRQQSQQREPDWLEESIPRQPGAVGPSREAADKASVLSYDVDQIYGDRGLLNNAIKAASMDVPMTGRPHLESEAAKNLRASVELAKDFPKMIDPEAARQEMMKPGWVLGQIDKNIGLTGSLVRPGETPEQAQLRAVADGTARGRTNLEQYQPMYSALNDVLMTGSRVLGSSHAAMWQTAFEQQKRAHPDWDEKRLVDATREQVLGSAVGGGTGLEGIGRELSAAGRAIIDPGMPTAAQARSQAVQKFGADSYNTKETPVANVLDLGWEAMKYGPKVLLSVLKGTGAHLGGRGMTPEVVVHKYEKPDDSGIKRAWTDLTEVREVKEKNLDGWTPGQAAVVGGAEEMLFDPVGPAIGLGASGAKLAGRGAAKLASGAVTQTGTLGPKLAGAIGEKFPALAESAYKADQYFRGTPAAMDATARQLIRSGTNPAEARAWAEKALRDFRSIGPRQNLAIEELTPDMLFLRDLEKRISRDELARIHKEAAGGYPTSLYTPPPGSEPGTYAAVSGGPILPPTPLAPDSQKAVDILRKWAKRTGEPAERLFGLHLRDDYVPMMLNEDWQKAVKGASQNMQAKPLPGAGGHFKQRNVPEQVTREIQFLAYQKLRERGIPRKEALQAVKRHVPGVTTAPEVNDYFKANPNSAVAMRQAQGLGGPTFTGTPFYEESLAKAGSNRYLRGIHENEVGRWVDENVSPIARKPNLEAEPHPDWKPIEAPGESVPSTLVQRMPGLKDKEIPSRLHQFMSERVPMQSDAESFYQQYLLGPWAKNATLLGSIGYYNRNARTNLYLGLDEYGPGFLGDLVDATSKHSAPIAGPNGATIGLDQLEAALAERGFARGTGAPPIKRANELREGVGLPLMRGGKEYKPGSFERGWDKATKYPGKLAEGTDDAFRMAVAIAEFRRTGNLQAAIDKAGQLITHTQDLPQALQTARKLMPFFPWNARAMPTILRQTGKGKMSLAAKNQDTMNAAADESNKLDPRLLPRRAGEQAAFSLNAKSDAGDPLYFFEGAAPHNILGSTPIEPLYTSIEAGPVEGARSAGSTFFKNLAPWWSAAPQIVSGQRALTRTDIDQPTRAAPTLSAFATLYREITGEDPPGMYNRAPEQDPENPNPEAKPEWMAEGTLNLLTPMVPGQTWAKPLSTLGSPGDYTPQEIARIWAQFAGFNAVPMSREREVMRIIGEQRKNQESTRKDARILRPVQGNVPGETQLERLRRLRGGK